MAKRRKQSQQATDPRVVGGQYFSGYGATVYTVNAIEFDAHGWLKFVTVTDANGTRTHSTAWDPRRDRVLATAAVDKSGNLPDWVRSAMAQRDAEAGLRVTV